MSIINFTPKTDTDEMISMDEWDGSCWKTLFDWFAENVPQADPWDCLAAFIKRTLMEDEQHGQSNTESKNT